MRFRALLTDGEREVRFERVAAGYNERAPYPQDNRSPHSADLTVVSVLLRAARDVRGLGFLVFGHVSLASLGYVGALLAIVALTVLLFGTRILAKNPSETKGFEPG